MAVSIGDKLLIICRRMFESDIRRHFTGKVSDINNNVVRVVGYAFIFDKSLNEFRRKPDQRTRIISLQDNSNIVFVLPDDIRPQDIYYKHDSKNGLQATDGKDFTLDINEFGLLR